MSAPSAQTGLTPAWDEAVRDIPEGGIERDRAASPEELSALAGILEVLAVKALRAVYRIRPAGNGRYALSGRLEASLEQACVVSLEPLTRRIEQAFAAAFWPAEQMLDPDSGAVDLGDEPEPEPIEHGRLPVGRLVFETLAASFDPFPRADGAVLDWSPPPDEAERASPFAALAKLKK
ncbi:MAG: DUF177 domain-containing protein [Hyphomicrobiaceae bacterium]|nr:DUF177 domain-containing protein [Hyphomicrobiaceae bacterium]